MSTENPKRMIVGISGATGVIFGVPILQMLYDLRVEPHLVVTKPGEMTGAAGTDLASSELKALADHSYPINGVGAAIASGSFHNMGMIVAPCSIWTLSEIAYGMTSNRLTRAADVALKEWRKLVLLVLEAPLHAGHLKSMLAVTEAGVIVAPPVPAFYIRPKGLDDIINHTAGRTLDLFGLHHPSTKRWEGVDGTDKE